MGKITVKHYLNKNLKPDIDDFDNSKYYPLYLTITVKSKNIKRKSNIIDSISQEDFDNNFISILETKRRIEYEKDLITRIIRVYINDIESNNVDEKLITFFDLKGYNSKDNFINLLNAYIDFYKHSIYEAVDNFCTNEIEKEIYKKITETFQLTNQVEVKNIFRFNTPLQEADFVYNNLSGESIELFVLREILRRFIAPYGLKTGYDIPLIDWIENLIQPDFIEFLKTYKRKSEWYLKNGFIIDNLLIDKYIKIIDSVVYSRNYFELAKSERKVNFM